MEKYNSIENLYKVSDIYTCGNVEITEKIHGTNVRIFCDGEKLAIGGRNLTFCEVTTQKEWDDIASHQCNNDGYNFVDWLKTHNHSLFSLCMQQGKYSPFTAYGEYFGKGIIKGVDYGLQRNFRIFDVKDATLGWLDFKRREHFANYLQFLPVPVFYVGVPTLEIFESFYKVNSMVAKELLVDKEPNVLEGIVIKPVDSNQVNQFGERIIVKFKNEIFAEEASKKEERPPVDDAKAREFAERYVTPQRLQHVIQHLFEDKGIIADSMKSTKDVIEEMMRDIDKEADFSVLNDEEQKQYKKLAGPMTAKLYKSELEGTVKV